MIIFFYLLTQNTFNFTSNVQELVSDTLLTLLSKTKKAKQSDMDRCRHPIESDAGSRRLVKLCRTVYQVEEPGSKKSEKMSGRKVDATFWGQFDFEANPSNPPTTHPLLCESTNTPWGQHVG